MTCIEIVLIAIGLSMDAFAVSITLGLSVKKPTLREYALPGAYFGFFQALMPLAGYFAGTFFAESVKRFDHWIAFALLLFIGGKMVAESFSKDGEERRENRFGFASMMLLSVATSIDALAVGVTFAFFDINIFIAVLIIGSVTFCISTAGVKIGNVFGTRFKSKAELFGGLVLVALGVKILVGELFGG
jgi:putative Mn2+ efflux pump MntP